MDPQVGQGNGQQHITITNCPICGGQLESGFVQSARQVFFSKKKHTVSFWPDSKAVPLTEDMLSNSCSAFICPQCKIIIVPF